MYKKLLNNPMTGTESQCVFRIADNAFIPFDPANTDYQAYLKWLEEGNLPSPADIVEPSPTASVEPLPADGE